MTKRTSITKKTRFDVFKRDFFTCQYCGATPPKAILEIDHIDPVANGGGNNIENLITACFDCNRGKSKHLLSTTSIPLTEHFKTVSEKEEQIKAHKKLLASIKRRKTREENNIARIFEDSFHRRTMTKAFKKGSIRKFLDILPYSDVEKAMVVACERVADPDGCVKYFCGTCWGRVRDNER